MLALALLSACAAPAALTAASTSTATLLSGTLPPYQTRTPTPTPFQPTIATPTPSQTPSPTPRTHVVKAGEDMSGIALRYRVKLSDLKTANPSVIPNAMKIGTVLLIPGTAAIPIPTSGTSPATPTPPTILLEAPRCTPDAQGGETCFALAHNLGASAVENVTAAIHLVDAQGKMVASQQVTTPLNLLPPGGAQPVMAYFPPPLAAGLQATSTLVSVLPVSKDDPRYLAVTLENEQVNILAGGLAAEIAGDVTSQATQDASQAWVAAVAYDNTGAVVGLRRWESSIRLPAHGQVSFALNVYSVGGEIAKVDLLVEARP
jgi:LysM repeat protein